MMEKLTQNEIFNDESLEQYRVFKNKCKNIVWNLEKNLQK